MNEIVRTTYEDQDKELWGGSKPKITLEYDRKNEFMLYVTIWYNRLMAKPDLLLSADELQTRIEKEFEDQKLWNDESSLFGRPFHCRGLFVLGERVIMSKKNQVRDR